MLKKRIISLSLCITSFALFPVFAKENSYTFMTLSEYNNKYGANDIDVEDDPGELLTLDEYNSMYGNEEEFLTLDQYNSTYSNEEEFLTLDEYNSMYGNEEEFLTLDQYNSTYSNEEEILNNPQNLYSSSAWTISPVKQQTKPIIVEWGTCQVGTITLQYQTDIQGGRPQFLYDKCHLSYPNLITYHFSGDCISVYFSFVNGEMKDHAWVYFYPN